MSRRSIGTTLVALGLGLALGAGAQGEGADLVTDGVRPELFLLYTGDVIGHIDPCG